MPEDFLNNAINDFHAWKEWNKTKFLDSFYNTDGNNLKRVLNIQNVLPSFKQLVYNNKALKHQDFLFQNATSLYSSLFFEIVSAQEIHRDEPYFWTQPAHSYFGTWLALEDTYDNNGPLIVIPGSHKLNPLMIDKIKIAHQKYDDLKKINYLDEGLWNEYQREIKKLCFGNGLQLKEVYVKKGDTIIWHSLLAHGGAKIKYATRTRLSFVFHTTPHDTPVTQINTFFNPEAMVKMKAGYKYESQNGRYINP